MTAQHRRGTIKYGQRLRSGGRPAPASSRPPEVAAYPGQHASRSSCRPIASDRRRGEPSAARSTPDAGAAAQRARTHGGAPSLNPGLGRRPPPSPWAAGAERASGRGSGTGLRDGPPPCSGPRRSDAMSAVIERRSPVFGERTDTGALCPSCSNLRRESRSSRAMPFQVDSSASYPVAVRSFRHSSGRTAANADESAMAMVRSAAVRAAAVRSRALTLAKTCSIGLESGSWAGGREPVRRPPRWPRALRRSGGRSGWRG